MSTYIPTFNNGRLKEVHNSCSSESPIPPGNILVYMPQQPNVSNDIPNVGVHNSNVVLLSQQEFCESRIRGNEFGLLRHCRSHEMFSMGSQISSSGIQFHSDQYPNPHESTQDSESYSYEIGNVISDSKYLEAVQELLHEVVNVNKSLKLQHSKREPVKDSKEVFGELQNEQVSSVPSAEEKQDLQNKMTKLTSMLNEVDRRYKQYYHEMQSMVSSFGIIAGCGAANPYTSLALRTISRHFRCLRDAINSQKKVISRRIGEPDPNGEGIAISRLRFVDQQMRQQRRVQQFGTMHQHIWRPQRGLPESSVSILRAWLFEHFLHLYPKDSEKIMIARQTGLTRSQVSNWFINARVRLWKPMVEEMYKEESIDAAAMDSNSSSEIAPKRTSLDQAPDMNQTAASSYQAHNTKMESTGAYTDFQSAGPVVNNHQVFGNTIVDEGVTLTLRLQHTENSSLLPHIMTSLGSRNHSLVTLQADDHGGNAYNADKGSSVGAETIDFSEFR